MFESEIPDNFQQKCLCIFLLDVSGSMRKDDRIGKLNAAMSQFYDDIVYGKNGVAKATIGRLEVAIIAFDQEPKLIRPAKKNASLLLSRNEKFPILAERGSTTETVKAIDVALKFINERKRFYDRTGQGYHRPWIVLLSDGKSSSPEHEIQRIEKIINAEIAGKHLSIIGLAIGDDVPLENLNRFCGGRACKLEGLRFAQFFQWLSNSFSLITQSNDDETIDISTGRDDWMKNYSV